MKTVTALASSAELASAVIAFIAGASGKSASRASYHCMS